MVLWLGYLDEELNVVLEGCGIGVGLLVFLFVFEEGDEGGCCFDGVFVFDIKCL